MYVRACARIYYRFVLRLTRGVRSGWLSLAHLLDAIQSMRGLDLVPRQDAGAQRGRVLARRSDPSSPLYRGDKDTDSRFESLGRSRPPLSFLWTYLRGYVSISGSLSQRRASGHRSNLSLNSILPFPGSPSPPNRREMKVRRDQVRFDSGDTIFRAAPPDRKTNKRNCGTPKDPTAQKLVHKERPGSWTKALLFKLQPPKTRGES